MKIKQRLIVIAGLVFSVMLMNSLTAIGADNGSICSGANRTGSIAAKGQVDSFTFEADSGLRVAINLSNESGNLMPKFCLYDPYGSKMVCASGAGNTTLDSQLIETTGLHTITVSDISGSYTGTYSLSLLIITKSTNCDSSDLDGGAIASGDTKSGTIDVKADMDTFTFAGTVDDAVVISMSNMSGYVMPDIILYDPNGNVEIERSGAGNTLIDDHKLQKSGLYSIVTRDISGSYTGDYNLSFSKIPATQVDEFSTIDFIVLPDRDGDGIKEFAALRKNLKNCKNVIQIKNGRSGSIIKSIACLSTSHNGKSMALVKDINGNGFPEVAVLGVRTDGKAVCVELRDSETGELIKKIICKKDYEVKELSVRTNSSGNEELMLLGINTATAKARLEIRDILTGTLVKLIYLEKEA
jgi:hypothetical protein